MIQAIIFDFDGVIVDSNRIKRGVYFEIFSHINGAEEFVELGILENPEKTRYGVIEDILEKLRERGLMHFNSMKSEKKRYASMYGRITEERTIKAREIRGARQTLENLSRKYPIFIVSSTITENLKRIVKERNLAEYFKEICGADGDSFNKLRILERLAKKYGFKPKSAVFVGDGKSDYECARQLEIGFIGIMNDANDFEKRGDIVWKLYDLEKLPEMIKEMEKSFDYPPYMQNNNF